MNRLLLTLAVTIAITAFVNVDGLIIRKAHCIIPKDVNSVTRALLLQQCFSKNNAQGNETVCYEELGCFPMESPWVSSLRPFPSPMLPDEIDVKLYLYTKNVREKFNIPLWPEIDLTGSDFNPNRELTVFITHGFASDGNSPWMDEMKNAYLTQKEANIFLVDWGKGAQEFNYLQVASNTRIVGAELGRFGKYLIQMLGLKPSSLHLIGHSLGAHISAYMAKNIAYASLGKPARITALDPAQPGFEKEAPEVRLDSDDALFVDVLHSDAKPFIPLFGFGMLSPIGHVDFYLNGGTNQPGCYTNITHHVAKITNISDLKNLPVEVLAQVVSCNHGRSYEVFTASLYPQLSCLWARKIKRTVNIVKVLSQGALHLLDPLISDISLCTQDSCTLVGFLTPDLKARGIFSLSTTRVAPFCVPDKDRDKNVFSRLTSGVLSIGISVASTVTNAAHNILTGVTNILS